MKLLFDTNVLVSAFVTHGYSFDVIKHAMFRHEIYYTDHMLKEVERILASKKFSLSPGLVQSITGSIKRYFIKEKTADTIEKICRDPADNHVLADAVVNGIELIITGDKDLLTLKKYQDMRIILPKEYWSL